MNLKEFSKEIVEWIISSNPSSMQETIKDLECKLQEYADQIKPKWIKVSPRKLPEHKINVALIVEFESGKTMECIGYCKKYKQDEYIFIALLPDMVISAYGRKWTATHWSPLPEKPEQ